MTTNFKRATLALLMLGSSGIACGDDEQASGKGYAAFAVDADEEQSRHVDGTLGFNFERGWTELRVGRLTAQSDGSDFDATTGTFSAGYAAGPVDVSASYAYREDSDSLKQHDIKGDLTYFGTAGSIGLDLFFRSAEYETVASIERRRRDPIAVRIADSTEGRGVGLHGDIQVAQQLLLFASAMAYDYDEPADLPAGLTRWERISVSGITRDDIWLQDTASIGATYDFAVFDLTADVTRDTTLNTEERIVTGTLQARIPLADRWMVSPWIGYSDAELSEAIAFGGIEVSINW